MPLGFFFSSRRRHTRWTGDWSSDVCSSDLREVEDVHLVGRHLVRVVADDAAPALGRLEGSAENDDRSARGVAHLLAEAGRPPGMAVAALLQLHERLHVLVARGLQDEVPPHGIALRMSAPRTYEGRRASGAIPP